MSPFRRSTRPSPPPERRDPLLEGWYHTIEFPDGRRSKGYFDHRTVVDRYGIPASLHGLSALDVATGDGFFAFEMERRGADRVVAVDINSVRDADWIPRMRTLVPETTMDLETWKEHFEMAHRLLGSSVQRIECNVYELGPELAGTFDVIFCGDLLLHLQNPLKALVNVRSVTRGLAIIETPIDVDLERAFPGKPYLRFGALDSEQQPGELNTFWRFSTKGLQDMMVYAGFTDPEPQGVFHLPPHGIPVTSVVARAG